MQVPQSIFLMNSTSSEQVSSLSSAALPPAQSSPISSPPSTGRPPLLAQAQAPLPAMVQLQALLQPLVQAAVQQALRAVQPLVAPTMGSVPVPTLASAPALVSSGGESIFPAFIPSVCLASGTPLAPSSAALQHLIASYMAFTPAPTACTNVLPYTPFVPSLTSTSTSVPSHTPRGSSAVPAGSRSRPHHLSFDVGPGRPPKPPKLVEQIQQGEFIDLADLLRLPAGQRAAPGASAGQSASPDSQAGAEAGGTRCHLMGGLLDGVLPGPPLRPSRPSGGAPEVPGCHHPDV